jgi:hypothetical protein
MRIKIKTIDKGDFRVEVKKIKKAKWQQFLHY